MSSLIETNISKDMNHDMVTFTRDGKFLVRIVRIGESYGLNNCIVNDETHKFFNGHELVEFYDYRHKFDYSPNGKMLGQFVSRYQMETLINHVGGLNLDGGIPEWSVSAFQMDSIIVPWLKRHVERINKPKKPHAKLDRISTTHWQRAK